MNLIKKLRRTTGTEREPEEELTLPEPARGLWIKTYPAVENAVRWFGTPRLGGGTLLAARWRHRRSVDIDISIDSAEERRGRFARLAAARNPFHETMTKLGAVSIEPRGEQRLIVLFEKSKLDILISAAMPKGGERRATVDGLRSIVLSTAQVLNGKLARSHELLPRDGFDFAAAARAAPGELARAVNRVPSEQLAPIVGAWANTSQRWAAAARTELHPVSDAAAYDPALLGRQTGEALRTARYRAVTIETHGRTGVFNAETVGGARIEVRFTRRTLNRVFDEHGIRDYLDANAPGFGDEDVVGNVRKACRIGTGKKLVYEATHREIAKSKPPGVPLEDPYAAGAKTIAVRGDTEDIKTAGRKAREETGYSR